MTSIEPTVKDASQNTLKLRIPTFDDIFGHENVKRMIKSYSTDRALPSMAISGPSGIGKDMLADAIGLYNICEDPIKNKRPCGCCYSCCEYLNIAAQFRENNVGVISTRNFLKIPADKCNKKYLIDIMNGWYLCSEKKTMIISDCSMKAKETQEVLIAPIREGLNNTTLIIVSSKYEECPDLIRQHLKSVIMKPFSIDDTAIYLQSFSQRKSIFYNAGRFSPDMVLLGFIARKSHGNLQEAGNMLLRFANEQNMNPSYRCTINSLEKTNELGFDREIIRVLLSLLDTSDSSYGQLHKYLDAIPNSHVIATEVVRVLDKAMEMRRGNLEVIDPPHIATYKLLLSRYNSDRIVGAFKSIKELFPIEEKRIRKIRLGFLELKLRMISKNQRSVL